MTDTRRKPVVALMGEFSAGKSTLTNLLLGAAPLPVRITATRLPPVMITAGPEGGDREDHAGDLHPLPPGGLAEIAHEETRLVRLRMEADILHLCDLIDMPGISDPNMDSAVWRDVIGSADILIWCTHATQAWRQSEAAAWDTLPEHLQGNGLLVVSRWDKLTNDRDRARVMARLGAEAGSRFRAIYPVSLTDAVGAGDDRDRWVRSGAEPFVCGLLDLILNGEIVPPAGAEVPGDPPAEPIDLARARDTGAGERIVPQRVRPQPDGPRRTRPAAGAHPA